MSVNHVPALVGSDARCDFLQGNANSVVNATEQVSTTFPTTLLPPPTSSLCIILEVNEDKGKVVVDADVAPLTPPSEPPSIRIRSTSNRRAVFMH